MLFTSLDLESDKIRSTKSSGRKITGTHQGPEEDQNKAVTGLSNRVNFIFQRENGTRTEPTDNSEKQT